MSRSCREPGPQKPPVFGENFAVGRIAIATPVPSTVPWCPVGLRSGARWPITALELKDQLYESTYAEPRTIASVHMLVSLANRELKRRSYRVFSTRGGRGARYYLERIIQAGQPPT
jgi:hypothetical protein